MFNIFRDADFVINFNIQAIPKEIKAVHDHVDGPTSFLRRGQTVYLISSVDQKNYLVQSTASLGKSTKILFKVYSMT